MLQDDQAEEVNSNEGPPAFLRYTTEQYIEAPGLVKLANEWQHDLHRYLAEKDQQLQHAKQEIDRLKKENAELRKIEKALEETRRDLVGKDQQLQLAKQELNHIKEGSFKSSLIKHGLSVLAVVAFGFGINFSTSTPTSVAGWILIFIGVGIQSISFYITYSEARKNI